MLPGEDDLADLDEFVDSRWLVNRLLTEEIPQGWVNFAYLQKSHSFASDFNSVLVILASIEKGQLPDRPQLNRLCRMFSDVLLSPKCRKSHAAKANRLLSPASRKFLRESIVGNSEFISDYQLPLLSLCINDDLAAQTFRLTVLYPREMETRFSEWLNRCFLSRKPLVQFAELQTALSNFTMTALHNLSLLNDWSMFSKDPRPAMFSLLVPLLTKSKQAEGTINPSIERLMLKLFNSPVDCDLLVGLLQGKATSNSIKLSVLRKILQQQDSFSVEGRQSLVAFLSRYQFGNSADELSIRGLFLSVLCLTATSVDWINPFLKIGKSVECKQAILAIRIFPGTALSPETLCLLSQFLQEQKTVFDCLEEAVIACFLLRRNNFSVPLVKQMFPLFQRSSKSFNRPDLGSMFSLAFREFFSQEEIATVELSRFQSIEEGTQVHVVESLIDGSLFINKSLLGKFSSLDQATKLALAIRAGVDDSYLRRFLRRSSNLQPLYYGSVERAKPLKEKIVTSFLLLNDLEVDRFILLDLIQSSVDLFLRLALRFLPVVARSSDLISSIVPILSQLPANFVFSLFNRLFPSSSNIFLAFVDLLRNPKGDCSFLALDWPKRPEFLILFFPIAIHPLLTEPSISLSSAIILIQKFQASVTGAQPLLSIVPLLISDVCFLANRFDSLELNSCLREFVALFRISFTELQHYDLQSTLLPVLLNDKPSGRLLALFYLSKLLTPPFIAELMTIIHILRFNQSGRSDEVELAELLFQRESATISDQLFLSVEKIFFSQSYPPTLLDAIVKCLASTIRSLSDTKRFEAFFKRAILSYQSAITQGNRHVRPSELAEKKAVRESIGNVFLLTADLISGDLLVSTFVPFLLQSVTQYENEEEILVSFVDTLRKAVKDSSLDSVIDLFAPHKGKFFTTLVNTSLLSLRSTLAPDWQVYVIDCLEQTLLAPESFLSVLAGYWADTWKRFVEENSIDSLKHLIQKVKTNILVPRLTCSAAAIERRSAAYCLASFVKSVGISLVPFLELQSLILSERSSKNEQRDGICLLLLLLSCYLGREFEAYILKFIPFLLSVANDSSLETRTACSQCLSGVMPNISCHGLALLLPQIIPYLQQNAWRPKVAAAMILGSMSNLAPSLLTRRLSEILKLLSEVMSDSHPEVQSAGKVALFSFSQQCKNPELRIIAPVLLEAIADIGHTKKAVDSIVSTTFSHYLSASDLALLIPIVHNTLHSLAGSELRKRGCQIVGNVLRLAETVDLRYYADDLLEKMILVLDDVAPEVRSSAAKVIGSFLELFAKDSLASFSWIIPRLLESLLRGSSGAGQAVAEGLAVFPISVFVQCLPQLLEGAREGSDERREVFFNLFSFLPVTLPTQYVVAGREEILSTLAFALCDSSIGESARQSALYALQSLIKATSLSPNDSVLFDLLERGLFDENSKIRASFLVLLGDVLQLLGESDPNNSLFSLLYASRFDTNGGVRLQAAHFWKLLALNSAKLLKLLLPTILKLCNRLFSSDIPIQSEIASKVLQDLNLKFSDCIFESFLETCRELSFSGSGMLSTLLQLLDENSVKMISSHQLLDLSINFYAHPKFSELLLTLKKYFGRVVEESLLPRLVKIVLHQQLLRKGALLGMSVVSGFIPGLLNEIFKEKISAERFSLILSLIHECSVTVYLEDIVEFSIKAASDEIPQDSIDRFAVIISECCCKGRDFYRSLIDQFLNALADPRVSFFVRRFCQAFFMTALEQPSMPEELLVRYFRCLFACHSTEEQTAAEFQFFISKIDSFRMQSLLKQSITPGTALHPQLLAAAVSFVTGAAMQQNPESSLQLLWHLVQGNKIIGLIQVVGSLIRVFGEDCSENSREYALLSLSLLLRQNPGQLRLFLPQLSRVTFRCLSGATASDEKTFAAAFSLFEAIVPLAPKRSQILNDYLEATQSARSAGLTSQKYLLLAIWLCLLEESSAGVVLDVYAPLCQKILLGKPSEFSSITHSIIELFKAGANFEASKKSLIHHLSQE